MNLREAAQEALEALEAYADFGIKSYKAITALRAALAEPEPRNQCGETCERAKLCPICCRTLEELKGSHRETGSPDMQSTDGIHSRVFDRSDRGVEAVTERQDWDEIESLRASLREHMAEIKRLNECLTWEQHRAERIGTHGPGCAMWGPKHYECLLREHEALQKQTSQESRQVKPVAWMLEEHGELIARKTTPPRDEVSWREKCELPAWVPLYATPPKREPLTDAEIGAVAADIWGSILIAPQSYQQFARAIERAHGIGGEE